MPNTENQPFEASYEAAKQNIISYMGEVARAYDIPIPLLNILIYEIALESRNASFSAIVGGCDVTYPEQSTPDSVPHANDDTDSDSKQLEQPTTVTMNAQDALKGLEKMGLSVTRDEPSDKSA